MNDQIIKESSRRRTFAIISHPDAGKTTLTEKLLLYGGALELAGSVSAKKKQRETTSDWMELEKKRGISISSTVLQFDYGDYRLNLLDTPGHKDFSEDTYRVLMAVDAVVMVIDAVKGIESQTRKLFEICRKRGIPIFTFMNKLDRPSKSPLELIDQLEKVLDLHAYPINWPLGNGSDFKGIYDRSKKEVHLFERVPGGAYRSPVFVSDLSDPLVRDLLMEQTYREVTEELEMLDGAHDGFDLTAVSQGKTTPVFFGSAANNFGVEFLLKHFLEYSAGPSPRKTKKGVVPLAHPHFSSFVFKVQTNMNPLHRDRVVFARVCSGRFSRDLKVYHARSGRNISLSDSFNLFGRDREVTSEAYPGDIVGFVTKLDFRIGDTLSTEPGLLFEEIPRFAPECFGFLKNTSFSSQKPFRKGLEHLLAEDIVQTFYLHDSPQSPPLLGAVGPLQFEVLQYRLKDEYKAESRLEMMSWKVLRWVESSLKSGDLQELLPSGIALALDDQKRRVMLFDSEWSLKSFSERNPSIIFLDSPEIK
ncbi:MAG TPA: peptide chain release factor 3 [Lentisphaeria bacterium]|nr:MAG: peptide chain release factor 3 [Lentisphaerae bacterium GWF2_50_93]HCE44868.1 peptide chain release factor 3 [Lentisphaeria bacterium]